MGKNEHFRYIYPIYPEYPDMSISYPYSKCLANDPAHGNKTCATSEDSDQPAQNYVNPDLTPALLRKLRIDSLWYCLVRSV